MAKNQSKLRDAVDAVFAPSQYLTHDGAAYAQSKLGQLFNRVSKPHYLVFSAGAALEAAMGAPDVVGSGIGLALIVMLDKLDTTLPGRALLKETFYDTKAQTRSFVDTEKASALESKKRSGISDMMLFGAVGGAFTSVAIASGEAPGALPYFSALLTWGFGNYWRPKQVLDGNWTLMDKAPPEKQTSKVKSAMPGNAMPVKIHNRDMLPTAEL